MDQHLVDHHLEEERREQCEKLQEERGQQHFGEQSPVPGEGGQEPAKSKAPPLGGSTPATGRQDQATAPRLLEQRSGQRQRAALQRIPQQYLAIAAGGDHEPVAILVLGDCRERGPGQSLPMAVDRTDPQA